MVNPAPPPKLDPEVRLVIENGRDAFDYASEQNAM